MPRKKRSGLRGPTQLAPDKTMNRFAIALSISVLLLLTPASFAQEPPTSGIPAAERRCDEDVLRSATAIAVELAAARNLISAQAREIEAARSRLEIEKQRVQALAEKTQLQAEQAEALRMALEAEREAKAILQKLIDEQGGQIARLEQDKKRSRKRAIWAAIAGVVAGAAIRR